MRSSTAARRLAKRVRIQRGTVSPVAKAAPAPLGRHTHRAGSDRWNTVSSFRAVRASSRKAYTFTGKIFGFRRYQQANHPPILRY